MSGNDVCEHQNANYLRMMSERDALRDVVRELDAVMHHHAERADAAEAEVERLRAGIEALLPGETVNVYAGGGNLVSQRRVVDPDHLRALLAGSGEQPGECPECGDAMCRCGIDWTAPVVPDSADVRDELLHVLDSHGIDTYIDGTGAEVGVQNLITDILAVVGRGVTAESAEAEAEKRWPKGSTGYRTWEYRVQAFIEGALWASSAVRPSGQEGS